jgi:pimeloyl-ACP methyl ester carboxylesterase
MPHFDRAGTRIFYEDTGSDSPAIVFSHGLLMDHEMFAPQMEALSDEFRCIAWDERGHGDTTTEGSWSYWDSAEDVVGLLDHLGVSKAILAGMSQGGFLSLRVALKAPDRVAGLFLIDTQAGKEPEPVVAMYGALAEDWATNGPNPKITDAVAASILGPAEWEPWVKKWVDRPKEWVREPFQALVAREDIHDRLSEISVPAHVVHGSADLAIPIERAEALCDGLPHCEGMTLIDGGGHASNLSHPEELNEILRDFARRHASTG